MIRRETKRATIHLCRGRKDPLPLVKSGTSPERSFGKINERERSGTQMRCIWVYLAIPKEKAIPKFEERKDSNKWRVSSK